MKIQYLGFLPVLIFISWFIGFMMKEAYGIWWEQFWLGFLAISITAIIVIGCLWGGGLL